MPRSFYFAVSLCVAMWGWNTTSADDDGRLPDGKNAITFVETYCLDCHSGTDAELGFRLDDLTFDLESDAAYRKWVMIHDRVQSGEMPPQDADQPDATDRQSLTEQLDQALLAANQDSQQHRGRVQYRRLNRVEYENTLRDLLALPELEIAGMLPPDASAHGFDNIGSALELSFVQMSRYLDAAGVAIDKAARLHPRPKTSHWRLNAKDNGRFSQVVRKGKEAVPIGDAVGLLRQPNTAQAPLWWSKFEPPVEGFYRLRMKSFGFFWDKGQVLPADRNHVVTFHAVQGSTKRRIGTFDVGPSQNDPTIHNFTAYIRRGDQIQLWFETLDDRNKQKTEMADYKAPGVAVEWLEIEGPLTSEKQVSPNQTAASSNTSYQRLFGELPVVEWTADSGLREPPLPIITTGIGKRAKQTLAKRNQTTFYRVDSKQPKQDARRLLLSFANRAFRRPVSADEINDIFDLVAAKIDEKHCFQEAMRLGYQAILCSPEFLFLNERPGQLDDHSLACRLSYFLWGSMPDATLTDLAKNGKLRQKNVLQEQTERMLDDPRSQRFVKAFCGQWLDLRDITMTQPDEQLYPEFDQLLLASMIDETEAYFTEMVTQNLGVSHLVDSDFLMINERLAKQYGISGVEGVEIRKVKLSEDCIRGGLLTQASVLKVTANGTTTSPVTRGAWVLDRIYGEPAPLPPPNVPAVEPDLRGATTIRQQLDKHRSDPSCASCHRRIDPPGFALESFDVIGGWRERYRALENGDDPKKTIKGGKPVRYKIGPPVDSTGVAPSGQSFDDIEGLRSILLNQTDRLARNMASRLLIYATGEGIQYADRNAIDSILQQTRPEGHGLRSLIHAVVQSQTFQTK